MNLTEYLIKNLKIDPARIYIHGLSAGGLGTWLAACPAARSFLQRPCQCRLRATLPWLNS